MECVMDVKALFNLTYGMYIISSVKDGKFNGQIANAVMQITADPAAITVCLNRSNLTTDFINSSQVFSVSVLTQDVPMTFLGLFGFKSGRDVNKFETTKYEVGTTGSPMVTEHALAVIDVKVVRSLDIHTHSLFVGEVVSCKCLCEGSPLTYLDYHLVKKGKSPKNAPTFGFNQLH